MYKEEDDIYIYIYSYYLFYVLLTTNNIGLMISILVYHCIVQNNRNIDFLFSYLYSSIKIRAFWKRRQSAV